MKKYLNSSNCDISPDVPNALLGHISINQFLAEYWQKKPLLIRAAIPEFNGLLTPNELAGLACEEDAQSRLIRFSKNKWYAEHGPFDEDKFAELPERDWTLLVQGLNHHLPEASVLLRRFNFIPDARLDDLMVSYAPDGGGVGPHFDSYDVFLLQGMGKRLWRISEQTDLSLVEGAPLRILKNFETREEWVLEPGDMLYLPPHLAHWGVAIGDCMTYSIGFRAPAAKELIDEFLVYLQDHCKSNAMYTDPDLVFQPNGAQISEAMVKKVASMFEAINWTGDDVGRFLAKYLSEPKPHIVFETPKKMSFANFEKNTRARGIALGLKSQLLYVKDTYFMNGELIEFDVADLMHLTNFANNKMLTGDQVNKLNQSSFKLLYAWYMSGYVDYASGDN